MSISWQRHCIHEQAAASGRKGRWGRGGRLQGDRRIKGRRDGYTHKLQCLLSCHSRPVSQGPAVLRMLT
jgi:hypothetical protein